jgi:L-asparagine oxygenase
VSMLRIDLPDHVTDRLRSSFASLLPSSGDTEQLLAQLFQACCLLPTETLRQLLSFRASPYADPAVLISGLPVDDDLPPTPAEGAPEIAKNGRISECAILSVAVLLGEPIAYRAEKNGALVQNVYPTRSQKDSPSNESSAAALGFHTELAFSRAAADRPLHLAGPDFVLLLGLRCPADRPASTAVVDVRKVCARLGEQHLAALRAPEFQLMAPYSFTRDRDGSRPWSPPVALLRGPADMPSLAFDTACGVRTLSPSAEAAVKALADACNDPELQQSVRLRAGDLLAINNNRCAHSRGSFLALFDGRDRWLQRVYVRHSIWPLPVESVSSFRVLT